MENNQLLEASKDQLNRILSFYSQVDAKASVVLAVEVGMLALLVSNAPPVRSLQWYMLFAVIPVFLIALSFWHLYKQLFPKLEGGHDSLIYFREIAQRTESKFIAEFKSQPEEAHIHDLLSQVWVTSEILRQKYDHLKAAFVLLALTILPWGISLAMFAAKNTEAKSLLLR